MTLPASRRLNARLTAAFEWSVTAPAYALGWSAGAAVRCMRLFIAGIRVGYQDGSAMKMRDNP